MSGMSNLANFSSPSPLPPGGGGFHLGCGRVADLAGVDHPRVPPRHNVLVSLGAARHLSAGARARQGQCINFIVTVLQRWRSLAAKLFDDPWSRVHFLKVFSLFYFYFGCCMVSKMVNVQDPDVRFLVQCYEFNVLYTVCIYLERRIIAWMPEDDVLAGRYVTLNL